MRAVIMLSMAEGTMAQVVIRSIDGAVVARLKARATAKSQSIHQTCAARSLTAIPSADFITATPNGRLQQ
ncbi:MAG TPA: hypothetical protein VES39_01525 [Rhodospirillales bacterium]|nr:hypothetical protein [Rhodospirillales bacterium]